MLGLITGAVITGGVPSNVQLLFGTGLCGALTTYSTLSAWWRLPVRKPKRQLPGRAAIRFLLGDGADLRIQGQMHWVVVGLA